MNKDNNYIENFNTRYNNLSKKNQLMLYRYTNYLIQCQYAELDSKLSILDLDRKSKLLEYMKELEIREKNN